MKVLGNDIYLQRGETWSLDFDITNEKGDPYMLLNTWRNPYLAITVTAARYEQKGDFRRTYWLDLNKREVERSNGYTEPEPVKRFISTEALPLVQFSVTEAIAIYGVEKGGKIVLDSMSDFDVTNYLFMVDGDENDTRIYKYVKSYKLNGYGDVIDEEWEEYSFRIIKQFSTKDWIEQGYLYDMKVLAGESIEERIYSILDEQNTLYVDDLGDCIDLIEDEVTREELRELYDSGMPLMPDYDTKLLVLEPTNIYVSANIQGGVR